MSDIQTPSSPAKVALPFGVFFGLFVTIITMTIYFLDINMYEDKTIGVVVGLLTYLILPITFIILAVKTFKDKHNEGFLSVVDGLKIGVIVCLIMAIISGIFNQLYFLIFPEHLEKMFTLMEENMVKQSPNMTQEQLNGAMEISKKFMSPWITIPISIAIFSFIGMLYGAIIGLIFKNERPVF
jgi:hypothetical protein